jgi:O-antigen/teichoic acid export membrane protein
MLGTDGFGELGMLVSTVGLFGVLAGFGLGTTATKYIAECLRSEPRRAEAVLSLSLHIGIVLSLVAGLALAILAPWLADHSLGRPSLAPVLRISALLLAVSVVAGLLSASLAGFEAYKSIAASSVAQGLATPVVSLPCIWQFGVAGAIAGLTASAAVGLWWAQVALRRELKLHKLSLPPLKQAWDERRVLWTFAAPSMLSALMVVPVTWATNAMLANHPNGYAELGLFNAANQLKTLIAFVPSLLATALLPVLAGTLGEKGHDAFSKAVVTNLHVTWLISLPLAVVTILLGGPLAALFGHSFAASAPMISLLMVATFLTVINTPIGTALAGSGRMWIGAFMNLLWGVVLLVTCAVLVPRHGGIGLALSYVIAYTSHTVFQFVYFNMKIERNFVRWPLACLSVFTLSLATVVAASANRSLILAATLAIIASAPLALEAFGMLRRANSRPEDPFSKTAPIGKG